MIASNKAKASGATWEKRYRLNRRRLLARQRRYYQPLPPEPLPLLRPDLPRPRSEMPPASG
jgi:hypothetical protein